MSLSDLIDRDRLDRLIAHMKLLANSTPDKFVMGSYNMPLEKDEIECGTAACLCGWSNLIETGIACGNHGVLFKDGEGYNRYAGWDDDDHNEERRKMRVVLNDLFLMGDDSTLPDIEAKINSGESIPDESLDIFDTFPPQKRIAIAVEVLEHFRDTGVVDWNKFCGPELRQIAEDWVEEEAR